MGEAQRKRGIAKAAAAAPVNQVDIETFHRKRETGEAIAAMLVATNAAREKLELKTLSRSAFIGYVLIPAGLQAVLADLARREAEERLVKTPDEVSAEARYVGRRA